ncbi:MAG TPA: glycosyltransferase family 4 protein, partial [Longimicrobiaceae bacterium]|nr:glycosyltransferase family 4 protein [Longimicrobiaceae bacterium]
VIDGLRSEGIELQVVSTDRLKGVAEDERFLLARPVYTTVRNIPEMPRLIHNDALLQTVEARWPEWRPDFVYNRYSMHGYSGPALRARFGVPYVCEYNGSFPWMNRHWGPRPMYFEDLGERIEMLNLRTADLVVVVSRAMKEEVVARGIDAEKVLVNPNGVDPDRYHPDIDGTPVRRRYRLESGLVVGFIGTFGPWHGAEKLVEAASLVREHGDLAAKVRFLLIGDGQRMGAVRQLIEEHGLQDRVVLTGRVPQEEGPAHLAACDILASPHVPNPDGTPFFGSPTKLFEYMAMGRAIVASDLDQIGEVLEHGRTGWLVEPGNADALARGIAHLCREADLRRQLSVAARREAEERHSWDSHTRRILEALRERLADGAPVGPTA